MIVITYLTPQQNCGSVEPKVAVQYSRPFFSRPNIKEKKWSGYARLANEWNDAKKLLRLPTLFKGRAWAIFESLGDDDKDTYSHLKKAMTEKLNPDTDENRIWWLGSS